MLALPSPDGPVDLAYDLDRPPGVETDTCVLYAHGFASKRRGEKADFFRARFLDVGLAFCRFDFRGHGDSGGRLFDLSLTRNLEDMGAVRRLLESEGFSKIVLMGSSMGGGTAAWHALHFPPAAAVHIAPGIEMDAGLARRFGEERMAAWERDGEILFEHELGDHPLAWSLIEDLRGYDRAELPRSYRTPTLIFQGVHDTSIDYRSVLDFAAGCEGAVHVLLMADGDHRLVDRLPYLWRLVRAFLVERGIVAGEP